MTRFGLIQIRKIGKLTEPETWRPLHPREICLFPRFPKVMPYNMTFYGNLVNKYNKETFYDFCDSITLAYIGKM